MDQGTNQILFALLRSAVRGTRLTDEERALYSDEKLNDLLTLSKKHDVAHLLIFGLKQNALLSGEALALEKNLLKAVYRYERLHYDYVRSCAALEVAKIPFIPLKGSVLRDYYPEAWMRTSCDIDILVRQEDLGTAISCLVQNLGYEEKERSPHDVSLFTSTGNHIELHFDLVEEGRANNAIAVLSAVWENTSPRAGSTYHHEMSDPFFYFYHIAHMAKHFESGGCGIRPFIDLWILDHREDADACRRDALLAEGSLLNFANTSRKLSEIWLSGAEADPLSLQMQAFILQGGVYGHTDNRVALQQMKKGGRVGYILSRIFAPYEKLKGYYPILEKHKWLTPIMQIRRWFMLLKPDVAKMAKRELTVNSNIDTATAKEMNVFLENIGLK